MSLIEVKESIRQLSEDDRHEIFGYLADLLGIGDDLEELVDARWQMTGTDSDFPEMIYGDS